MNLRIKNNAVFLHILEETRKVLHVSKTTQKQIDTNKPYG